MANNNVPVNVTVNFSGVSYNAATGTWSGAPSWTVAPVSAPVPPVKGTDTNTVVWTLRASAVPSQFSAAFAGSAGIAFTGSPAWTGGTPTLQADGTYSCQDNFNNLPADVDYPYGITVTLSGSGAVAGVTQNFSYDPDVENESGSAPALRRSTK